MLEVRIGDLFESKAQTLVNTVNCVGIMGKGVALGFKQRFPEMLKDYQRRCERGEVRLGRPYLFKALEPPWILNFPTKDHWRSVARLADIVTGLEYLLEHYREWGIGSMAVPPLGCGEGQLEWRIVGRTLYRYLNQMDIPVELFAPYGTRTEELQLGFLGQDAPLDQVIQAMPGHRVKPAWVALVEILRRLEEQPYHRPIGRTAFQKIAYVATDEGLPTDLHYQRGSYGPFSPEVKRLTSRLVNNGLIREERLGRMHAVKVGPNYEDARKAYSADLHGWERQIQKISDLFMRTDSKQAEIVATVLFAARQLMSSRGNPSELDVVDSVMDWKQRRKPPLEQVEVAATVRNLAALGWLEVKASQDLPLAEPTALDV